MKINIKLSAINKISVMAESEGWAGDCFSGVNNYYRKKGGYPGYRHTVLVGTGMPSTEGILMFAAGNYRRVMFFK